MLSAGTAACSSPEAEAFVRFCYQRRRVGWPELYDEMCAVAGRGLFRGYDADDLAGLGIGFSLFDMPALSVVASRVVAEEQALRRPMTVTITAAISAAPMSNELSVADLDERPADVPIRLALAPSGA